MNVHNTVCRLVRVQSELGTKYGRQPTLEELASACDLEPAKVSEYPPDSAWLSLTEYLAL